MHKQLQLAQNPLMETGPKQKVEQVKACLNALQDPNNSFHEIVEEERGVDWQAENHSRAKGTVKPARVPFSFFLEVNNNNNKSRDKL